MGQSSHLTISHLDRHEDLVGLRCSRASCRAVGGSVLICIIGLRPSMHRRFQGLLMVSLVLAGHQHQGAVTVGPCQQLAVAAREWGRAGVLAHIAAPLLMGLQQCMDSQGATIQQKCTTPGPASKPEHKSQQLQHGRHGNNHVCLFSSLGKARCQPGARASQTLHNHHGIIQQSPRLCWM